MNVGIYNRWLPSLGGGERYSLAMATHLVQHNSVDVISHTVVEPGKVAARVDMDLSGIRFRAVPLRPPVGLGPIAAQYDLFINASNGDFVPPAAPRNAMLVYFPMPPPVGIHQRLRRMLAAGIKRLDAQPRFVDGVFGLDDYDGLPTHGLGRRAEILLPSSHLRPLQLRFSLLPASPTITSAAIDLENRPIRFVEFARPSQYAPVTLTLPPGGERVLAITAQGACGDGATCMRMTPIRFDSARERLYRRAFETEWPELGVRLQNILPPNLVELAAGYDLLWAISQYTQRWIGAYWNLPSELLYPPVDVERFAPGSKRSRILSVGRFFAGNHNKKHLVMVHAFRRLVEDGMTGWELHLAGGLTPGQQHKDYLQEVHNAARGLHVHIHVDLPQPCLTDLFATSSIYWHAAGYGESPIDEPGKFEHFGISVVEAMAAGCVPVVVGQGGLTELVHHGRDGFLWYATGELRSHSEILARDAALRSRMAQAAIVSSQRFSRNRFTAKLDISLASLMGS